MSKVPRKPPTITIRPLNPLDAFRCIVLGEAGEANCAYPLASMGKEPPTTFPLIDVCKAGLRLRDRGRGWVWWYSNRVYGLATAQQRSGPQSWEITHLSLGPDGESHLTKLLETVSQAAGSKGGERVFIRLRQDDPLVDAVRLSGFFPCVNEVLYRGLANRTARLSSLPNESLVSLRKKKRGDSYAIFQLYNATTPSEVRSAVGMTFDQWMASFERGGSRIQEFVLDTNSGVRVWLKCFRHSGSGQLSAIVHPDDEELLGPVVDFGLERLKAANSLYCLVPEHQESLKRVLWQRGFEAASEYVILVKSMVAEVKEGSRARATAA